MNWRELLPELPPLTREEIAAVAHHEAGHVVAQVRLRKYMGFRLPETVWVDPETGHGQAKQEFPHNLWREMYHPHRFRPHASAVMSLAGPLAMARHEGREALEWAAEFWWDGMEEYGGGEWYEDEPTDTAYLCRTLFPLAGVAYNCADPWGWDETPSAETEAVHDRFTRYMRRLAAVTARMVERDWAHVERIAAAILAHPDHYLWGDDLRAAIAPMLAE